MTEEATISSTLGLDIAQDYAIPDSLWDNALQIAFDPDTAVSDSEVVPDMDDDVVTYDDDAVVPESVDDSPPDHDSAEHDSADHDSADHGAVDHGVGDHGDDGAYDDDGISLGHPSDDPAPHVDDSHSADHHQHWHD